MRGESGINVLMMMTMVTMTMTIMTDDWLWSLMTWIALLALLLTSHKTIALLNLHLHFCPHLLRLP